MIRKVIILFLFFTFVLAGQEDQVKFRLLDKSSYLPIVGATYVYGNQAGQSDTDGLINIKIIKNEVIRFSHLSYGKWNLNESEILSAVKSGSAYKELRSVNLYPVTVVAVREKSNEAESYNLNYRDKMAHDGGTLLSQTSAISGIRKSGGYGFDPVLRGFKFDQLNVVLNGAQCATAACPNRMDPPTSQMSPNMIDRVEVLKGPHALRFGGGFGGTINYIPAPLRFTNTSQLYGRLSSGFESSGDILRNEGLVGFSKNNIDFSLYASWSQGNDYRDGDGNDVDSEFSRGSFSADLGLKFDENNQLRFSATRNIARDAEFAALPMDLRDDDTWMFNLRHDMSFGKQKVNSWNTTLFGSFVDHLMDNLMKTINPRMVNASTNAKTHNYGARTEGVWRFIESSLYAGADFRVEGAEGKRIREFVMGPNKGKVFYDNAWQESQITKVGLFSEYHLSYYKTRFVLSGRLEYNNSDITDAAQEFTNVYSETDASQFNPSISLGGLYSIDEKVTIGFWLGRAQRSGSLTERFINYFPVGQDPYELLGNPQIEPEVINQFDLTFDWKTQNISINIDLFAAYMQAFISSQIDTSLQKRLPNSPGVRRFVNLDEAMKTGFEFSWKQKLPFGLQSNLSLAYTYAEDLVRNEPLPEIAPLDTRLHLVGHYLDNRLKPELIIRHVTKQSRVSKEFGESVTPNFTIVDIKLAYKLFTRLGFTFGINNLFDKAYYEHLSRSVRGTVDPIYANGRNIFLSLNLDMM